MELNRRAFLKSAGVTAVLGAVGAKPASAIESSGAMSAPLYPKYDFDEVYSRLGTNSSKWDSPARTYGEGIIGMGIADMDFRAAPCITAALAERCAHQNWGYAGRPEGYVDEIVAWNKRRYNLDVDPGSVVLSSGVHPGIIAALKTFVAPRSRVIVNTPTYNGFYGDIRAASGVADDNPLTLVDGRYSIDFEDFERRARGASAFILCNPQNPTGNLWSAADLMRLGEICLDHNVIVLSDEIHCDFVQAGQTYVPFASLPNTRIVDNSITFKSTSKSFSISSMKSAWYFSSNADYIQRIRANGRSDVGALAMVATHAALSEGEEWLDELLVYLDANHDFAEAYIRENIPSVKYTKAEGTFLAWLDVTEVIEKIGAAEESASSGRTPESVVQRWLAENARVYLNPGTSYGTGGAGHMRMNIGTPRVHLEQALENMARVLA